jgi:hypothetical protein
MNHAYTRTMSITDELMERFKRIHDKRITAVSEMAESSKLGELTRIPKTNTWLYVLSLGCAAAEAELGMDASE